MLPRLEDYIVHDRGWRASLNNQEVNIVSGKRKPRSTMDFPILNPDAAGVDVGSEHIHVAVPPERFAQEVRIFPTFTQDLKEAATWMVECGIKTVAMESTGVYWIPFFQILEESGIAVFLVNARHIKNVPAAFKTDRRDSRWLRNLHAVGLLNSSFRPEQAVCTVRSIARHRDSLTKAASRHVLHMQKALSQMNLLLHEVISDITGVSGLAILDAILKGERDPDHLVQLCDNRIKASDDEIRKALVGDWREEHLFTLRQSLASWRHFQQQVADCNAEISRLLSQFEPIEDQSRGRPTPQNHSKPHKHKTQKKNAKAQERNKCDQLKALFGVDLTEIPGIGVGVAELIFTEVGRDLSRFHSANHFASWLGLAPNNSESGGKVLSRKTRRISNRLATQLRLAANTLTRNATFLGAYMRKMKSRLGAPKGVTATAHKLARIIYTLITTRTPYDETVFARQQDKYREQRLKNLKREAATFGFDFVPHECVS